MTAGAAAPRDAATVLLVRNAERFAPSRAQRKTADGVEVWMMRRQPSMMFAPNAWVFPGGAVLAEPDAGASLDVSPGQSAAMGVEPDRARSILEAALRETFEECGVALAAQTEGAPVRWSLDQARALQARRTTLDALLRASGAHASLSSLRPWARWLTPESSRLRFDTWFFAVDATSWPPPRHIDDGEASASRWWHPGELLEQEPELLLPPTRDALQRLAQCASVADVLAAAPTRVELKAG